MLCKKRVFFIVYFLFFFIIVFMCLFVLMRDDCVCPDSGQDASKQYKSPNQLVKSEHKLGLLVPFRDRFNELMKFAPYITKFLKHQSIDHQIYVLNQVDGYRFNRASLINVGFKFAKEDCDYVAMHDVDLFPLNNQLRYDYPKLGVYHVSSPELHPKYDYPTFVGGILLIKREDYELVNGMSNRYWGWGLEDDEFYVRLKDANIPINRPTNIKTKKNNTFWHFHDKNLRKRDMQKCFNQREVTHKRDHVTGLHDVKYVIESVQTLVIDEASLQVLNIKLKCNRTLTPWCTCDPLPESLKQQKQVNVNVKPK